MHRLAIPLLAVLLAACAPFPQIEAASDTPAGPPPPLLPIDDLLAQAGPSTVDPGPALAARAARLKARAAALDVASSRP